MHLHNLSASSMLKKNNFTSQFFLKASVDMILYQGFRLHIEGMCIQISV